MLEPWDELETLQKGRRDSLACARDLEAIRDSCVREHNQRHVVDCPECWARLINRLRDRYLNSAIIKEWFSGRRPFLQELDDLFARAREHEVDFKTVEQRIADEKKEWFRDKVRNLGLQLATRSLPEAQALQQRLSGREIPAGQLVSELRECLGEDAALYDEVSDTFSKHVKTSQPPTARARAYIDALFQPERDPAGAAKSKKYIDMITDGKPVAEVMNTMARDRQLAKGDLQKKMEELRRARAAHELKNKRDQMRQEKAREESMKDTVDALPPCSVCGKAVNARKYLACPLCQLLADHFKVLEEPVLFCSEACHDEGYDSHVKASHECSSGSTCLSLDDPGAKMQVDEPLVVFCRECVRDLGRASVFCSLHCYDGNFQRHRDGMHIPERERRSREVDDKGQLEFDPEDDMSYSATKIEEHVVSLHDAMMDWQSRTEASIS